MRPTSLGSVTAVINSAGLEGVLDVAPVPRQPVEMSNGNGPHRATGTNGLDLPCERAHRDRRVARVCCNAGVTHADDGVLPVLRRRSPRSQYPGNPLVAWLIVVVKVRATSTLEQIACSRGHVAQLARGACEKGAREHAVVTPHARVGREILFLTTRHLQLAFRSRLDLIEREVIRLDEVRRSRSAASSGRQFLPPAMNLAP